MDWLATLIIGVAAAIVGVVIVRREIRDKIACAKTLRREVAELDLRWPTPEDSNIPGVDQLRADQLPGHARFDVHTIQQGHDQH